MSNTDYEVCVTTSALNKHLDKLDNLATQTDNVIKAMIVDFDLQNNTLTQEDIESDLIFEINQCINLYGYNLDADEIMQQIFKEFKIKEAE